MNEPGEQRRQQHALRSVRKRASGDDSAMVMRPDLASLEGDNLQDKSTAKKTAMRRPVARRIAEPEERTKSLVALLGEQERARDTRRKILQNGSRRLPRERQRI
jgi:hypothetical protein